MVLILIFEPYRSLIRWFNHVTVRGKISSQEYLAKCKHLWNPNSSTFYFQSSFLLLSSPWWKMSLVISEGVKYRFGCELQKWMAPSFLKFLVATFHFFQFPRATRISRYQKSSSLSSPSHVSMTRGLGGSARLVLSCVVVFVVAVVDLFKCQTATNAWVTAKSFVSLETGMNRGGRRRNCAVRNLLRLKNKEKH